MPWIAEEAGLFKKYNLDFRLVFIASSPAVTAAMLGGDAEIPVTGGEGNIRAYVQGSTYFVFIGAVKNVLTHSIVARPDIKRPEDLKGKKIGINRIGSNPHYFAVQALRQKGLDPNKDVQLIQSGGSPETLAALVSGALDAASLNPPSDTLAVSQGFHYLVYGPDQLIPYASTTFVTLRPALTKRSQVLGQFMRAMAEAAKIVHADKEFTYKVLGKYLRVTDRKILDASYNVEIKKMEPRLSIKPASSSRSLGLRFASSLAMKSNPSIVGTGVSLNRRRAASKAGPITSGLMDRAYRLMIATEPSRFVFK